MPEGDVLARCANRLGQALNGTELTLAELRWPSVEPGALLGETIIETVSYGKNLFQRTSSGWTLHTHLRMDGLWRIARTESADAVRLARHPKARVLLGNDRWMCAGIEIGMLHLLRTRDEGRIVDRLGPDLLAPAFERDGLKAAVAAARERSSSPVCEVLLDQRVVAGIGTIYMAESLFALQLWPWMPIRELSDETVANLLTKARSLMMRVVTGGFEARISHVHGRRGRPCHRCGTPILRGTANPAPYERPVFYCPRCQDTGPPPSPT